MNQPVSAGHPSHVAAHHAVHARRVLLAAGVGAGAWLFNRPFLSSSFFYVDLPLLGALPVASALIFDLGVFALVVGATVLMLIAIAHQSVRSHRAPDARAPGAAAKVEAP